MTRFPGDRAFLAQSADLVHWQATGTVNPHFPSSCNPYEFCAAVTSYRYQNQWWMYYGAGGSVTSLANVPLRPGS